MIEIYTNSGTAIVLWKHIIGFLPSLTRDGSPYVLLSTGDKLYCSDYHFSQAKLTYYNYKRKHVDA